MRVLFACDSMSRLDSATVGRSLAAAWQGRGAQCAVVAMADAGLPLLGIIATHLGGSVVDHLGAAEDPSTWQVQVGTTLAVGLHDPNPSGPWGQATSVALGAAVAQALATTQTSPTRLIVDLSGVSPSDDAGAGFLAALGACGNVALTSGGLGLARLTELHLDALQPLRSMEIIGLVPRDEQERELLGLRGVAAVRGYGRGLLPAEVLQLDDALRRFVDLVGVGPGLSAGACGGVGYAIQALGGTVISAPQWCADQVQLDQSIALADLVVTACDACNYHQVGTPVTAEIVARANAAGVPVIMIARAAMISARELRTHSIESCYELQAASWDADSVTAAAHDIAQSWLW